MVVVDAGYEIPFEMFGWYIDNLYEEKNSQAESGGYMIHTPRSRETKSLLRRRHTDHAIETRNKSRQSASGQVTIHTLHDMTMSCWGGMFERREEERRGREDNEDPSPACHSLSTFLDKRDINIELLHLLSKESK